jgi:hypothetical protein
MAICTKLIDIARPLDVDWVADNLQLEDRQELEGLGLTDMRLALRLSVANSDNPICFWNPDGMICGVAGVSRTDAQSGAIWMLTTPYVRQYPKLFFKEAKKWLAKQTNYDLLYNIADPRNQLHLKLLHLLGFKRLSYVSVGPDRLTYVEFAKLVPCASEQKP